MKLCVLQHVDFEGPSLILDWALEHGYSVNICKLFDGEELPKINEFNFLIIMGGPMGIYDESEYSWLKKEKEFIKEAIAKDKFVLGICLGAQLIADCLGAKVSKAQNSEKGWLPITWVEDASLNLEKNTFPVFHLHGDGFEIPDEAKLLASSEAHREQAFLYKDKVLALQFHLEMNQASIETLFKVCPEEFEANEFEYLQSMNEIEQGNLNIDFCKKFLFKLLDSLVKEALKNSVFHGDCLTNNIKDLAP